MKNTDYCTILSEKSLFLMPFDIPSLIAVLCLVSTLRYKEKALGWLLLSTGSPSRIGMLWPTNTLETITCPINKQKSSILRKTNPS